MYICIYICIGPVFFLEMAGGRTSTAAGRVQKPMCVCVCIHIYIYTYIYI